MLLLKLLVLLAGDSEPGKPKRKEIYYEGMEKSLTLNYMYDDKIRCERALVYINIA